MAVRPNLGMDRPVVIQTYGSVWITGVLVWIGLHRPLGSGYGSGFFDSQPNIQNEMKKWEWTTSLAETNNMTHNPAKQLGLSRLCESRKKLLTLHQRDTAAPSAHVVYHV